MRKVIINSTPLIALCKVKKLGLLHDLYGEVTIPDAVFHEVSRKNDRVKKEIEESIDLINKAFEALLNDLFEEVAMDISTDISALKTLFTQDGLTEEEIKK